MFVYWIVGTRLVAAALASVCWTLIVQQAPPSFPYPFTALGFVFVPLGAMLVFGEPIATEQWVGDADDRAGRVGLGLERGR